MQKILLPGLFCCLVHAGVTQVVMKEPAREKFFFHFNSDTIYSNQRCRLEVYFKFDKMDLVKGDSTTALNLDSLYCLMKWNPGWVIQVRNHEDGRTDMSKYSRKLSQRRAQSVTDFLVKEKQIHASRLVPKGMSDTEPIYNPADIKKEPDKNKQEAMYRANRRTDFSLLSTDHEKHYLQPVLVNNLSRGVIPDFQSPVHLNKWSAVFIEDMYRDSLLKALDSATRLPDTLPRVYAIYRNTSSKTVFVCRLYTRLEPGTQPALLDTNTKNKSVLVFFTINDPRLFFRHEHIPGLEKFMDKH